MVNRPSRQQSGHGNMLRINPTIGQDNDVIILFFNDSLRFFANALDRNLHRHGIITITAITDIQGIGPE